MSKTKGKISICISAEGSKSDGSVATLCTKEGKEYILYREDIMPQDDSFFAPLDGQDVEIDGDIEERGQYLCVRNVLLANGETLVAPSRHPSTSSSILIDIKPEESCDDKNGQSKVISIGKRLPRKLKKQLKQIKG